MDNIPARNQNAPDDGAPHSEAMMRETSPERRTSVWRQLEAALHAFDDDESGVAMTEYIIVFSAITFGATLAMIATTVFVKAYRDFLVWWLAHPAV